MPVWVLCPLWFNSLAMVFNPVLLKEMPPYKRCEQILYSKLKDYFQMNIVNFRFLDKVALQLTSGNNLVRQRLRAVYYAQYINDLSMRRVQNEF